MRTWIALFSLASILASLSVLAADPADGVKLTITEGPGADQLTLDWEGGRPTLEVFRSVNPATITSRANSLGTCDAPPWIDTPPSVGIVYYRITTPFCTQQLNWSDTSG